MMTPLWIFDLDNTLYPADSGLFRLINSRIAEFMTTRIGIDPAAVPRLREEYWKVYGLTLVGLMEHHGVDPGEYLSFVHNVPVSEYLHPDPAVSAALAALPGRRVVFTNGSEDHVMNVLARLGIDHLVEAVFDIAFMDYQPKPKRHGYEKLLRAVGTDPALCWMVDDMPANLDTGRSMGMATVLVGEAPRSNHRRVRSVRELPGLLGDGGPSSGPV
jgi:putative hydrolase of the HAD superfamily